MTDVPSADLNKEVREVAESLVARKDTDASACLRLDAIATKHSGAAPESDAWKRFRRSLDSDVKTQRELMSGKKKPAHREAPSFTMEQDALADEIRQDPNPTSRLLSFLQEDGYILTPDLALMMLLISGFRKINQRVWKETGSLKSTQTLLCGPHGSGKTMFMENLLLINDAEPGYPNGVVRRIGRSSGLGLVMNAGEDGKAFQHKIIAYEEVGPDSPFIPLMWSTTTSGSFTHISSSDGGRSGRREGTQYTLHGPMHHVMTSVRMPHMWDTQFVSRSICMEFGYSAEMRDQVVQRKLSGTSRAVDGEPRQIQAKAWNAFLHELKSLDPESKEAYAAIDMSVINEHLLSLDRKALSDDDPRRLDIMRMMIGSHAIIHQHHRQTRQEDGRTVLIATAADLNGIVEPFNRHVTPTTKLVRKGDAEAFRAVAFAFRAEGSMTKQQIRFTANKCDRTVDDYLKAWRNEQLIQIQDYGPRGEHHYELGPVWEKAKRAVTKSTSELGDQLALKNDCKLQNYLSHLLQNYLSHLATPKTRKISSISHRECATVSGALDCAPKRQLLTHNNQKSYRD